jgi:hypothetical protein
MAVISSYVSDNFLCVYHYFRALAVVQPFPGGEGNLERIMRKVYDKWRTARHASATDSSRDNNRTLEDVPTVGLFKQKFLNIVSVLYLKAG